jgi:hypothetical protein
MYIYTLSLFKSMYAYCWLIADGLNEKKYSKIIFKQQFATLFSYDSKFKHYRNKDEMWIKGEI